jgi:chorismate dehydratase
MRADLDAMLQKADAAILIGDPALLALEEVANRSEREDEELVYHDLAKEWFTLSGLPFVSAVWAVAESCPLYQQNAEQVAADFLRSRDHGLQNREALAAEWAPKIALPEQTILTYLTSNIHYLFDEDCLAGMSTFFRLSAEAGILPRYTPRIEGTPRAY